MNIVDGACDECGTPTPYTGSLPILCAKHRNPQPQPAFAGVGFVRAVAVEPKPRDPGFRLVDGQIVRD